MMTNNWAYKDHVDAACDRLRTWWNGGDIGRPALLLTAPRPEPLTEEQMGMQPMEEPPGYGRYSIDHFDYRLWSSKGGGSHTAYLAEAFPTAKPAVGPDGLAMFLGCMGKIVDRRTVWVHPCIEEPEDATFEYDPDNEYWQFTLRLAREQLKINHGKKVEMPELNHGLDTLSAMRGNDKLLFDVIDRPEWVRDCITHIRKMFFVYYDKLYETIRDQDGSSFQWIWAPGRVSMFQCDFSYMISPDMFKDFMVPDLTALSEGVDYSIYHWDGIGALPHHDLLLSIPGIDVLQWNPGAGKEPVADPKWWPLFHKTIDAGKKVLILCDGVERLRSLKKEFGPRLKKFVMWIGARTMKEADEILKVAEC